MTDLRHPTNGEWELFDPLIYPAPRGVSLLLINEGGCLLIGQWYEGALSWGYKPQIPATVKARLAKSSYYVEPGITRQELTELLNYDEATGVFTWKQDRGRMAKAGSIAGSADSSGYLQIKINGRSRLAHRLAWLYVKGRWPSGILDHKNRDKLDNRIENLRSLTNEENCENRGRRKNNSSGHTGVQWSDHTEKWRAFIQHRGVFHHLGYFDEKESAVRARRDAEEQMLKFRT